MKNKYCPDDIHRGYEALNLACVGCKALNRQREDMEKELADKLEGELSFSKGQGWRGEEAFKMIERDLERIIQSLKGGDKLEVEKEV